MHLGDFIRWAWDQSCQAPDKVIKTWLRESEPAEEAGTRLHILFRIAGYESTVTEAVPESLHQLTTDQWKRIVSLANTRRHLIHKEPKDYRELKSREQDLAELDADMEATTGIPIAAQKPVSRYGT